MSLPKNLPKTSLKTFPTRATLISIDTRKSVNRKVFVKNFGNDKARSNLAKTLPLPLYPHPLLENEMANLPVDEVWRNIQEFPGYSISDEGRVRNDATGRIMALLKNQNGIVHVGLTRNLVQYKRTVAILVASAFVPKLPQHRDAFDTPINLDGDRTNNNAANLMWRPRWFAVKYFHQFDFGYTYQIGFTTPIEEVTTGEQFKNSWDAATKYGLLDREIFVSTINRTYVWPTYQKFRVL